MRQGGNLLIKYHKIKYHKISSLRNFLEVTLTSNPFFRPVSVMESAVSLFRLIFTLAPVQLPSARMTSKWFALLTVAHESLTCMSPAVASVITGGATGTFAHPEFTTGIELQAIC